MDLFEHRETYSDHPGYRDTDTSKAAAESMIKPAARLRLECLGIFHYHGELTADEVAEKLDKSVLSIRPRITELKTQGKIVDTGKRRKNDSGRSAAVFKIA